MTKVKIKGLNPTEVWEIDNEGCKQFKNIAESLNKLVIGENLGVLISGSVSFGICKEGTEIGESYDGKTPLCVERVWEDRYLIKKDDSLITDLNLKEEWRYAMIKRFGKNFTGVACKLIEPLDSTAYIY